MPRKNNKTDHVLNLLAGKDTAEEKDTAGEKELQSGQENKQDTSHIQVVDHEEDKIADEVSALLEEELEQEGSVAKEPEEESMNEEKQQEEKQQEEEKPQAEEKQEEEKPQAEEQEYEFLNVMELLVREKAPVYMKQFGNCMCSRCMADTIALSLVHLPPKYVVVNKNAVAPLLNFYSNQYAGQVTVEITKSCIRVNENPHHDR